VGTAVKKIGVITATIVGMNAMIGAGIFSVPIALGGAVGPAGLLTYLFVIIAVWCMGNSLARLAAYYPQEGSFYIYARQWGGHYVGLVAGGLYLIGVMIAMGLLSQIIGSYLHHYIPGISAYNLGIIALGALTLLNMIGVHISQAGQIVLICTTVFPLLALTGLCLLNGSMANFVPFAPHGWLPVFSAARIVIFGFFGFECAASLFEVVENPQKNVSRALVAAIILVGILYSLFVGSIIFAVPLHYFSDSSATISQILSTIFPQHPWFFELIHFAILSAMVGTVHSMLWSAGSLLTAFLKQAGFALKTRMGGNLGADQLAVLFVAIGILISYVTLKDIDLFFSLTALFIVGAIILSLGTLLAEHREQTPWQKIQTVIGLLTAGIILYFSLESFVHELKVKYTRVDGAAVKML
jgi:amino acid efflux transporter